MAAFNQSNENNFRSKFSSLGALNDLQFYVFTIVCCVIILYIVFFILRKKEYDWMYGPKLDAIAGWIPGIQKTKSTGSTSTPTM